MSARRFAEWQAYCSLEPFGPPAEFWRAGLIASAIRNANRAKSTDPVSMPEDFLPESMRRGSAGADLSDRAVDALHEHEARRQAWLDRQQGRSR